MIPARRDTRRWVTPIGALSHALLAFLFPDACLACDRPLERNERHLCSRCRGGLLPRLRTTGPRPDGTRPLGLEGPYFLLPFDGPTRELIHALKYGGRTSIARELADLALPETRTLVRTGLEAVVPVPLHRVRLRERGFNQSALVAAGIAEGLGVEISHTLGRVRATRSQTVLSRDGRTSNVEGAFRAEESTCRGRRLILVDDVVTTGATLRAAAAALTDAGALSVTCLAVAGEILKPPARERGLRGGATTGDPETG
jgi:ComF family protein